MTLLQQTIARELLDAADRGATISSITTRHPEFGWDDAYRALAAVHAMRAARGEVMVGRKIGFTNRNLWPVYGATSPIWAPVYRHTMTDAPGARATVSLAKAVQPKIEPEIAFCLRSPVPAGLTDPVAVLGHVEWMAPTFEVVHCHFADWRFTPAESAADAALHYHLVVGPRVPVDGDLATLARELQECRVALYRDNETMDLGTGANALGHPALALAFLADIVAQQPYLPPLAAGEIITTGTLTAALPIKPGEIWSSGFVGIGLAPLQVTFTD